MTKIQLSDLKTIIEANPRRFIAQELIEFYDEECYLNDEIVPRKADFRAYVVMSDEPKVWKCGLQDMQWKLELFSKFISRWWI